MPPRKEPKHRDRKSFMHERQTDAEPAKLRCPSPGEGSPFMVSGELFLRSTPQLFESETGGDLAGCSTSRMTSHPSAGLLAGVSADLKDTLLRTTDQLTVGNWDSDRVLLSRARREQRSARLERICQLETSKRSVACKVEANLGRVRKSVNGFRRSCGESLARLDTRLGSLVLRCIWV